MNGLFPLFLQWRMFAMFVNTELEFHSGSEILSQMMIGRYLTIISTLIDDDFFFQIYIGWGKFNDTHARFAKDADSTTLIHHRLILHVFPLCEARALWAENIVIISFIQMSYIWNHYQLLRLVYTKKKMWWKGKMPFQNEKILQKRKNRELWN